MERTLICNNNVPIYYYKNEHVHSFCICLYVRGGVLYEKSENNGITHFWEHMVFKNINENMKGKLSKNLDRLGVYFNGCTYKELVEFKITGANKNFRQSADIITKVFEPTCFTDKDLEIEKKRIKSEIREDDDESTIDYLAGKTVWKNTNLSMTVAGSTKNVDSFNRKKFEKLHAKLLTANNMFFYVTGGFTEDDIDYLKELIDKYEFATDVKDRENNAKVPKRFFKREGSVKISEDDKNEIRFSFDFDTTKYSVAEIDLLYDILFDGECCKVFKFLSDKTGLIYSYTSSIEQYNNIGNIFLSYEVREKRLLESIEKVILILKKLKKGLKDELEYVKPVYIDNAEIELDMPDKLNWIMAYEGHVLNQPYRSIEERKKAHVNISAERIEEIVNEIFTIDNLCVTIKSTNKKLKVKEIEKIIGKL